MGQFKSKLKYKIISENQIELMQPLIFVDENGNQYRVPTGFKSDGLSVPAWANWFQEPFGFGLEAGIVHDYILENPNIEMSFLEANDVFDEALKALGMGWWKRNTLELATDFNAVFVHRNNKPNNWGKNQS